MPKIRIAIFFTVIFTLFIMAPTVISVIEDSYDTSIFFSANEEENQNQSEVLKINEAKFLNEYLVSEFFWHYTEKSQFNFYLKHYTPHTLECVSPPPEQHIL
ncbi:MAG TPA: hypothetical protein VKZ97_09340 [Flavobacteriaceae bacterium]|nr:hypothetical protein [Flavobacteriaceae bacterium]